MRLGIRLRMLLRVDVGLSLGLGFGYLFNLVRMVLLFLKYIEEEMDWNLLHGTDVATSTYT